MQESDDANEFLEVLEGSIDLGDSDLILIYDIINKMGNRGIGEVEYSTGMDLVYALTHLTEKSVCQRNPICFW